jgi:tetratricopeptide (TPR) repeat protein
MTTGGDEVLAVSTMRLAKIEMKRARESYFSHIAAQKFDDAIKILVDIYNNLNPSYETVENLIGLTDPRAKKGGHAADSPLFLLIDKLEKTTPQSGAVKCMLGYAYRFAGRTQDALCLLEEALEAHAHSVPVLYMLNILYRSSRRVSDVDKAIHTASRLCFLNPDNRVYTELLVSAYMQKGDRKQAIKLVEEVHRQGRGNNKMIELLATNYLYMDRFADADQILASNPDAFAELKLQSAFLQGKDARAHDMAVRLLENKFDPVTAAVWIIASGQIARAQTLLAGMGVDESNRKAVASAMQALSLNRKTILVDNSKKSAQARGRIPVSRIYEATYVPMIPVDETARRVVFDPYKNG